MQIALTKPELTEFVSRQVQEGRFASAEAVIEAGLARLMLEPDDNGPLDHATTAAIEDSLAQIDRGECVDFKKFASEMRQKYGLSR